MKMTKEAHEALGRFHEQIQEARQTLLGHGAMGLDLDKIGIDVCAIDDMEARACLAYANAEVVPDADAA